MHIDYSLVEMLAHLYVSHLHQFNACLPVIAIDTFKLSIYYIPLLSFLFKQTLLLHSLSDSNHLLLIC